MERVAGLVWPLTGRAEDLADLLVEAGRKAGNVVGRGGDGRTVINNYLVWAAEQLQVLRGRLSTDDLNRLVTTPRYWATSASPYPAENYVGTIIDELTTQAHYLASTASTVRDAARAWRLSGADPSLALVDTNVWMELKDPFSETDWHDLVGSSSAAERTGHRFIGELRLLVPILVIDELDGLSHRGDDRGVKARRAVRSLYRLFSGHTGEVVEISPRTDDVGAVTAQLLFDPPKHVRASINDDELVARAVTLRDFLGAHEARTFFLTHDTGAAFRADSSGINPCLIPHSRANAR